MARSIQTIIDGMDADFDHDNVQVYIQDYTTLGNDNQTTTGEENGITAYGGSGVRENHRRA